jgi:hypothetical protein
MNIFSDLLPPEREVQPRQVEGGNRETQRLNLENYTGDAIFAERSPKADIFPMRALSNLVERHHRNLPTIVVLGDKGAGKSYTFMSMALSRNWNSFVERVAPEMVRQSDASILPVTTPQDLSDTARKEEREITRDLARTVSGGDPLSDQLVGDVVERQRTSQDRENLSAWRNFWLDLIAWRCGHRVGEAGAFEDLPALLGDERRVLAIFDGIETIFSRIKSSEVERIAVEALLRAVPDWIAQLPDRRIGAIIFIREDVARLALTNNFKQFEDRYGAFALKWNWAEASALAFWIAKNSGAISSQRPPRDLVDMDEEARGRELAALWGWKLGPKSSREARSQEWVMSSLSDFTRRIKARDLVRFLHEASKRSTPGDNYYDDRLLSPRAMRDAVDPCSSQRVAETGEENPELNEIFDKIKGLPESRRELPWILEQAVARIGVEAIRTLEGNGVFFRDGDEYYVPEIYRNGLRFFYSGGARRKVVTLMRRAPNQVG